MPNYPPLTLTAYVHPAKLALRILWTYAHNSVYHGLSFAVKFGPASFGTFLSPEYQTNGLQEDAEELTEKPNVSC